MRSKGLASERTHRRAARRGLDRRRFVKYAGHASVASGAVLGAAGPALATDDRIAVENDRAGTEDCESRRTQMIVGFTGAYCHLLAEKTRTTGSKSSSS